MKLFVSAKKTLAKIGIDVNRSPFNGIVLLFFGYFIISLSFSLLNLRKNVSTFKEYAQSTYLISAGVLVFVVYAAIAAKMLMLFELLNGIERVVNERE